MSREQAEAEWRRLTGSVCCKATPISKPQRRTVVWSGLPGGLVREFTLHTISETECRLEMERRARNLKLHSPIILEIRDE